jgi:hypothetical protein
MLGQHSATPSLLTTIHVGIDGYPHLPRHTMPNHTELCALVRFALRTVLATKVQHVYDDRVCGLLGAGETVFLCDEHVNLVA